MEEEKEEIGCAIEEDTYVVKEEEVFILEGEDAEATPVR